MPFPLHLISVKDVRLMIKKKRMVLFCIVLSIALIAALGVVIYRSTYTNIVYLEEPDSVFYPEFYDYLINYWPSDSKVEPILDYMDAAQKGQRLWENELVGQIKGWTGPINPGKYVEVYYIEEQDTWVIEGTSPYYNTDYNTRDVDWTGALPCAIIRSDGTVLAVGIV